MTSQHPDPLFLQEGYRLNAAGHVISTYYVDFRSPADRTLIQTLIKVCEARFAIEVCGTVRISKPECFRGDGETLLNDPEEVHISRTVVLEDTVDAPRDLTDASLRDAEANRAAELVGMTLKRQTSNVRRTRKSTTTLSNGKNGWIFCTAQVPTSGEESKEFLSALPAAYDHFSYIHQPPAFALELGSMVAAQHGPCGRVSKLDSHHGDVQVNSRRKSQPVFHGPVLYVTDPYSLVERRAAESKLNAVLLPMFVKRLEYQPQREYRFVIWSEEEPTERCLDLAISPIMLGTMQGVYDAPLGAPASPTASDEQSEDPRQTRVRG